MAFLYFVTDAGHAVESDATEFNKAVPSTIPDTQKIELTDDIKLEILTSFGDTNVVSEPEISPDTKDNHFQEVGIIEKGIVLTISASTNNPFWNKLLKFATALQLDYSNNPSDSTLANFPKGRVGFIIAFPANDEIMDSSNNVAPSTTIFNITPNKDQGYIMRWPNLAWNAPSNRLMCSIRLVSANKGLVTADDDL